MYPPEKIKKRIKEWENFTPPIRHVTCKGPDPQHIKITSDHDYYHKEDVKTLLDDIKKICEE